LCSPQGNLDPPVAKEIEATQEHLEVNVLVFVGDTAAASAEDNKKAVTDATVQAFGGISGAFFVNAGVYYAPRWRVDHGSSC
jgi:hypothetical protein